jgi:hypothetical protein
MRILRGLRSRLLPCGCVAGIYETYDGEVVTLLDDRNQACQDATHENGNRIPDLVATPGASEVSLHSNRQR